MQVNAAESCASGSTEGTIVPGSSDCELHGAGSPACGPFPARGVPGSSHRQPSRASLRDPPGEEKRSPLALFEPTDVVRNVSGRVDRIEHNASSEIERLSVRARVQTGFGDRRRTSVVREEIGARGPDALLEPSRVRQVREGTRMSDDGGLGMIGGQNAGSSGVVKMGVGDQDPVEPHAAKGRGEPRSAARRAGVNERGPLPAYEVRSAGAGFAELVDVERLKTSTL